MRMPAVDAAVTNIPMRSAGIDAVVEFETPTDDPRDAPTAIGLLAGT